MLRKIFLAAAVATLTSCSYVYGDNGIIQSRDTTYLKANTVPPLNIPPGMSSSTIQSHYPISDRYYPGSKTKVNLIPPGLNTNAPAAPAPIPRTEQQRVQQAVQQQPVASAAPVNATPTPAPQGKPRTLVDYFRNGGSLTNVGGPAKNSNQTPVSSNTKNPAAATTAQQAPAAQKPHTIMQYLQGGGSLTNL